MTCDWVAFLRCSWPGSSVASLHQLCEAHLQHQFAWLHALSFLVGLSRVRGQLQLQNSFGALLMLMTGADPYVPLLYCAVPYHMWLRDDPNLKRES